MQSFTHRDTDPINDLTAKLKAAASTLNDGSNVCWSENNTHLMFVFLSSP